MRTSGWLVALSLVTSSANLALAAPPKSKPKPPPEKPVQPELPADVETAEALYAKLDYDRANDVAERVIKGSKGLSHDQLVRVYRVLAVTYAILDKEEQARDAFQQLLVFEPDFAVDSNLGPKVSTPFLEARGHFRSLPSKPGIEVTPNVRSDGGQLRVVTRDPTHIAKKVSVGWRWTATGDFTVSQVAVGEAAVDIPASPGGRTRIDFWAQALDERENVVFEAGSQQAPKSVFAETGPRPPPGGKVGPAPEKSSGSIFGSPVFWIITGGVLAAGGTAAFFAFRPGDPTSASLSPAIRCGAELCK